MKDHEIQRVIFAKLLHVPVFKRACTVAVNYFIKISGFRVIHMYIATQLSFHLQISGTNLGQNFNLNWIRSKLVNKNITTSKIFKHLSNLLNLIDLIHLHILYFKRFVIL